MARISRAKRRAAVRDLVLQRDHEGLLQWMSRDSDTPQRVLALTFQRDERSIHRAIEALGKVGAALAARGDLEAVRGLIRRLLWLMNDESGGIAWHGPETIAELLDAVPDLLPEYGRIVASFIDESPFGPGVHRAIARLAESAPDQFGHVKQRLVASLDSPSPVERAYALIALRTLDPEAARRAEDRLASDPGELTYYDPATGEMATTTVGELVSSFTPART